MKKKTTSPEDIDKKIEIYYTNLDNDSLLLIGEENIDDVEFGEVPKLPNHDNQQKLKP